MSNRMLKVLGVCSLMVASVIPATGLINNNPVVYAASKQKQESVSMLTYKDSKNHIAVRSQWHVVLLVLKLNLLLKMAALSK